MRWKMPLHSDAMPLFRLRFKHVEYVSPDDHEPDQSEGFSLIAISGQGHITAEWCVN